MKYIKTFVTKSIIKQLISFLLIIIFIHLTNVIIRSQIQSSLTGQIENNKGEIISDATILLIDSGEIRKTAVSNERGRFSIGDLSAGKYTIQITAPKKNLYKVFNIELRSGEVKQLTVILDINLIKEEVQVNLNKQGTLDSDSNLNATILKNEDLDTLPDDPDELEAYLKTLAGPAAGPAGGEIYIDGFTGGRIPPKEAIREIRINSNPFSAEFDRIGLSRIEIFTKPGSDQLRGSISFNYNDARFNSRNPFALNRAPAQTRNFSGYLSGPLLKKKASFFLDASINRSDRDSVVTATILNPALNIINLNQDYKIPTRRFSFSPRIDFQINEKNTLVQRYSFAQSRTLNQGIGDFSLASGAYNTNDTQHIFQLTETNIIDQRTVNETKFQYGFYKRNQQSFDSMPTINVLSAFVGGGSQSGNSSSKTSRWEFQNNTTRSFGENFQHSVRFGIRVRGINILDHSEAGYNGTFIFTGVREPLTNQIQYSSIEQYRQKLLGNQNPLFNPSLFFITTGNPEARVKQFDYGTFVMEDWRIRANLSLSLGLRYENQTNIRDNFNVAPRLGIAWSPLTKDHKPSKTVLRGGLGIFYDRIGEYTRLNAKRNDGISQIRYVVTNSNILSQPVFSVDRVINVPTVAQIGSVIPLSNTPSRIAQEIHTPRAIQTAISYERSLPHSSVIALTFLTSNSINLLRQRNINAPICSSIEDCYSGISFQQITKLRPDPKSGNIYQVESTGISNSQQIIAKFSVRLSTRLSFRSDYTMSFAKGTVDSLAGSSSSSYGGGFPAYSYSLVGEYAPISQIPRHNLNIGLNLGLPFGLQISPYLLMSSGRRFNIVTGVDTNNDSIFTERPTYWALNKRCSDLGLHYNFCSISGISNLSDTIPRNYGRGPGSIFVNMNVSKTFKFGNSKLSRSQNKRIIANGKSLRNDTRKLYSLTVGVNIQNVFNHVNLSPPQGNLSSPYFGQTTSTGGAYSNSGSYNRRLDFSFRFGF